MKIEVNKLQGLKTIANGYTYDTVTRTVTSTRVRQSGAIMSGSSNNGIMRYTFMLQNQYKTRYNPSMSVTLAGLISKAAAYMVDKCLQDTETTENVGSGVINSGGWVIGTLNNGIFTVATKPKFHTNVNTVNAEMERLAKQYPDRIFVKLKVEGMVVASGIKWF